MDTLEQNIVDQVIQQLPTEVIQVLKLKGIYLGGGYVRDVILGSEPKDIDLFVKDQDSIDWADFLLVKVFDYNAFKTKNAITFKKKGCKEIQIITRWKYLVVQEMIADFDFTMCKAGIQYTSEGKFEGYCHDRFMSDTRNKILFYTQPIREEECVSSLKRAVRFANRGYTISNEQLTKLVARAMSEYTEESDITDYLDTQFDNLTMATGGGASV